MRSLRWFLPLASLVLFACSNDDGGSAAETPETVGSSEVALSVSAEPLKSFNYDTGLIPAGSPAQVQLKLSAGGGIKVEAAGKPTDKGLEGKKGSGKVSVDLHVKLDGQFKTDASLGGADGDLPGVKDIDIAIKGETSFDPFLVGDKQEAKLDTLIPAADLPEIPLGATPAKLRLSIASGSILHSSFKGSCVSVAKEKATYAGDLTTSGTLTLKGTIVATVLGFEKELDLGQIEIPIPALTAALDFAGKDAKGAKDASDGAKCGAAKKTSSSAANDPASVPAGGTNEDNTTPSDSGSTDQPVCSLTEARDMASAIDLGGASDTDSEDVRTKKKFGHVGGEEVEWYRVAVRDEGFNGNPTVRADVDDPSLEVTLVYACTSAPDYSSCRVGEPDTSVGTGCRGFTSMEIDTGCSGTTESGTAYIRVRSTDSACHSYGLSVFVF